jgi:hypothetical protein
MTSSQEAAVDDDVRVVHCGSALCHAKLLEGEGRAESTCAQYVKSLNAVHRLLGSGDTLPHDFNWIKDSVDRIIEVIQKKYTNKGSPCNKLTPLMALSRQNGWLETHREPMNDEYLTQFIREIPFSDGRHLTINHLRHIFLTDRYQNDASLADRQYVASRMLHSVGT